MRKLPAPATVAAIIALTIASYGAAMATAVTNDDAAEPAPSARGLAFAQAHCSGCHAVTAAQISPNPEAPPFEAVINTQGLTQATLKAFLSDSHNFPETMNFAIDPDQIDDLSAYMITLRKEGFRPPTQ